MGEIRLFHRVYGQVFCLENNPFPLEDPLHEQIEDHLVDYLGVHRLARKVTVGSVELDSDEKGQIDTLGIDMKGRPVIIEYKRGKDQGVVPQALDYRDWLLKNKPMFRELLRDSDQDLVERVVWKPRIIVIAGEVTQRNKRDATRNKNTTTTLELVRYRRFGNDHLELEWVYGERPAERVPLDEKPPPPEPDGASLFPPDSSTYRTWDKTSEEVRTLFQELLAFAQTLGPMRLDVFSTQFSLRRMKEAEANLEWPPVFAQVRLNQDLGVRVWVLKRTQSAPPPDDLVTVTTDHWIVNIDTRDDLEKAKPLLRDAYERY